MVLEHQEEHPSQWSAITSIAASIGVSREALRRWVRQAEVDQGFGDGLPAAEATTSSIEPGHEGPALRLVRQPEPRPQQPLIPPRLLPEVRTGGLEGLAVRHGPRVEPEEIAEVEDETARDEGSSAGTRFLSWDELQAVADEADDIQAVVRKELEGLGEHRPSEPELEEFPEPRRRWRRLLVVGVAAGALGAIAIVVPRVTGDRAGPGVQPSLSPAVSVAPPTGTPPPRDPGRADETIQAELAFSAPCWVRAVADGRTVFVGTLTEGTRTFDADRTLDLTLGNAGGVQLVVNGRPISTGSAGEVVQVSFALRRGQVVQT
jgi:hypothetical protein